jgi:hypothetical protein
MTASRYTKTLHPATTQSITPAIRSSLSQDNSLTMKRVYEDIIRKYFTQTALHKDTKTSKSTAKDLPLRL